jgi:glycosyltransferase involved in cell wall biosynthesis
MGSDPFELERLLLAYDVRLTIISPGQWPINPFGRASTMLRALDPWRALRVVLRERRHDVVVAVTVGPALPLLIVRRLARFSAPILQWDITLDGRWRLRNRIHDFVIPRLDGMMVLSSVQPAYITRRWSSAVPVTVIGHSIDTTFYRPMGQGPGDYILAVGDDIGRDFPKLLAAMDGIRTQLVLRTSHDLSPAAKRLTNLRVMPDRVSESAFRSLYANSRFVVVPLSNTLNASGVSTILEAGAMGKATIVSASAGIDDFVIAGETCLRVPCHDSAALHAAIHRLLNEPETCERLGQTARRFVAAHCSRSAFAKRFAAALRSLAHPTE